MSGSATPSASTRFRMTSTALSIEPVSGCPLAVSTTEMPPCRSNPRRGFNGRVQTSFVRVAGVGEAVAVGEALAVPVGDGDGVGDVVVVPDGVGVGDEVTGTDSVVQFATAAIDPQIPTMRIT